NEPAINRNLDIDLNVIAFYTKELASVEHFIEQSAKQHNPQDYQLLQTVPGIGRILALTILYEIGNIQRFPTVQQFASYSRLIKCKAESAGKQYGTNGNKIGNAYLKWAFSEAAVLYLRGNEKAKKYLTRLQKRMSKAKALSALAHKLGRCIYFMLRNKTVFDEHKFLPA
ncbi:transposase, partial [Enterovibrio sp. ZSDZ35]